MIQKSIINKLPIIFLIFVFFGQSLKAQETGTEKQNAKIRYDEGSREWKAYESGRIEEFRQNNDFVYERKPADLNFWERVWSWLWELISSFFRQLDTSSGMNLWFLLQMLLYGSLIALFIYIIIKFTGSGYSGLGFRNLRNSENEYEVSEENIHQIDFKNQIDEAVQLGEFRKAIRLLYLYALKQLSDKQLIEWESGKTNHDYLYELKTQSIKNTFTDLGYYFEFTWYGNFKADKAIYDQTFDLFKNFQNDLERE